MHNSKDDRLAELVNHDGVQAKIEKTDVPNKIE